MAIVFLTLYNELSVRSAYNNTIIEVTNDSKTIKKASVITYERDGTTLRNTFEINPINNKLRFNYKNISSVYIDSPVNTAYDFTDSYGLDESLHYYMNSHVNISYDDETTQQLGLGFNLRKGISQINEGFYNFREQNFFVNDNLKMFVGYPFDYTYWVGSDGVNTSIKNESNSTTVYNDFSDNFKTYRIKHNTIYNDYERRVLLDGGTFESNSCYNKKAYDFLDEGLNILTHEDLDNTYYTNKKLYLTLEDKCGGIYLRWLNNKGGYNYWLFNPIYKENLNSKSNDFYYVQSENLEDTTQTKRTKSKKTKNTLSFNEKNLNTNDLAQVKSIIESEKIEMFNGNKFDIETYNSWQSVLLNDGVFEVENTKRNLTNFSFTIEINRYDKY